MSFSEREYLLALRKGTIATPHFAPLGQRISEQRAKGNGLFFNPCIIAAPYQGALNLCLWTNEFTRYQVEFTASANHTKLEIDLGACGGEVYFDNVSLVEQGESTNLIANGDFETQGTDGWSTSNNTMAQVEYVNTVIHKYQARLHKRMASPDNFFL